MSLFRRGEPQHVRLAREAGLSLGGDEPARPPWDTAGIHGLHRPREWDTVLTVEAPELVGDRSTFTALPGGRLLVGQGSADPAALASAVERELEPPYRAEAVRQGGSLWAVGARRIVVFELPDTPADVVEVTERNGETAVRLDGALTLQRPPDGLREAVEGRFGEFAAVATRLEGDLFELAVTPL